MMLKYTLAIAALLATAQAQSSLATVVGSAVGDFNRGMCLAFQTNHADTTTTCYTSCDAVSTTVAAMLNSASAGYNGQGFTTSGLTYYYNILQLQVNTQVNACYIVNFLFQLDNRLSDSAFLYGTISNLASQAAQVGGYYGGSVALTST